MTPPRPVIELGWAIHRAIHRVAGARLTTRPPTADGRVGTLFLATTGRRSGKVRRNGLFYLEDDGAFVVVPSNAGADADPAWWLNLQATPDAVVEVGSRQVPVRGRAASAVEAERLWPRLEAGYADYTRYRATRTHPIPVVILEPREPSPPKA